MKYDLAVLKSPHLPRAYNAFFRKRSELPMTDTDDKLMAAPARMGGKIPTAASGMLTVL